MSPKIKYIKLLVFSILLTASYNVLAMSPCPPQSSGGQHVLAFTLLAIAIIIASVVAVTMGKNLLTSNKVWVKIVGILASICVWLLLVYIGLVIWEYYNFTCF